MFYNIREKIEYAFWFYNQYTEESDILWRKVK